MEKGILKTLTIERNARVEAEEALLDYQTVIISKPKAVCADCDNLKNRLSLAMKVVEAAKIAVIVQGFSKLNAAIQSFDQSQSEEGRNLDK